MFPDLAFNWLDWLVVAIVAFSMLVSLVRGFVREALSLASWVLAFFLAMTFSGQVSLLLGDIVANDSLRYACAWVVIFLAVLIVVGLLNRLLSQVIKLSGLSGVDRLLGTVFGFARGVVLVMGLLFVARTLIPAQDQQAIKQSAVVPHLNLVVEWAQRHFSGLFGDGEIPWLK